MKLVYRLPLLLLLLAMVPLISGGYLFYVWGMDAIRQDTIYHLEMINHDKEGELNRWMDTKKRDLRELGRRSHLREYSETLVNRERKDNLWRVTRTHFIDDILNVTIKEEGNFLTLFLIRASDGRIVASTEETMEGMFRDNESYFLHGKENTFLQNAYYSVTRKEAIITVSTPVRDRSGKVIAVLAGHVNPSELSDIMRYSGTGSCKERTFLVNSFNFIIAGPSCMKEAIHTAGVERALKGENGWDTYADHKGKLVIGYYRWLPSHDLGIISEIDEKNLLSPVLALRNRIMGFSGILVAFVLIFGVILARRISGPILELAEGAVEVGKGNLDHRIECSTGWELDQISKSFNNMTLKLKSTEETLKGTLVILEDKVAERTRELTERNLLLEREIEERKRTEEDLKKNEASLLHAQRMAMLGSWERDMENDALTVSEGFLDLFGVESSDTDSIPKFLSMVHPEDREGVKQATLEPIRVDVKFSTDYRIIKGDGEIRFARSEWEFVKPDEGKFHKEIGTIQDITEQKLAEQALRQSEERLKKISEGALEGIVISGNGVILEANPQIHEMLGYSHGELVGKSILDEIVAPEDRKFVSQKIMGGHRETYRHDIVKKDGSRRTVEVRGRNTQYRGSDVRVASIRDITDRIRSEEVLKLSEFRYRELFENIGTGIIVYQAVNGGEDFIITEINKAVETIEDVRREATIGKSLLEIFPGVVEFGLFDVLQRVHKTGVPEHFPLRRYEDERIAGWRKNFLYRLPTGEVVAAYSDETERKERENQIAELQERLNHIITGTPAVIYTCEATGDFAGTYVSDNVLDLTGYEQREFTAKSDFWISHVHEEDRERILTGLASLLEEGKYYYEYRFRIGDGTYRWMGDGMALISDGDGAPREIMGYWIDVTDRVLAEEELRISIEFENLILEISTDLIAASSDEIDRLIDRTLQKLGKFTNADRCYLFLISDNGKMMSLAYEWIYRDIESDSPSAQNIPLEEAQWFLERMAEAGVIHFPRVRKMPEETVSQKEIFLGESLQSTIAIPMVSHGVMTGFLGLSQVRYERSWKDSEITLLNIVSQNLANTLSRVKLENRLLGTTAQMEFFRLLDWAILNQTGPVAIGKICVDNMADICTAERIHIGSLDIDKFETTIFAAGPGVPDTQPENTRILDRSNLLYAEMYDAFQEGKIYVISDLGEISNLPEELAALEAEGFRTGVMIPIRVEEGVVGFMECWSREPHPFPEVELEIFSEAADSLSIGIYQDMLAERVRRYTTDLEYMVQERTEELQKTNEELESFTYSVTHDLKAPLRALQGFSNALLEDYGQRMDSTARDYTIFIKDSAQRMDKLILDLLAYSRLGKSDFLIQAIDLREIVKEALDRFAKDIIESRAEIELDVASTDVNVHILSMILVVENLVANAIKFIKKGQVPKVKIRSEIRSGSVRLWVEDQGIGIDPQHQDRIFKVFERLHGIETYPGTGIGLAIAKRVISRNGGSIGVESQVDKGSRFWIEIPLA